MSVQSTTVCWNITISPEVDQAVRMFITAQGGGRKGDVSRFIEEAVRTYLLERAVEQAKIAASDNGASSATSWAIIPKNGLIRHANALCSRERRPTHGTKSTCADARGWKNYTVGRSRIGENWPYCIGCRQNFADSCGKRKNDAA